MPARIAIVIPTWNRREMLERTLESLRGQAYPIDRVIVVDNGSTDDSAAAAERYGLPRERILLPPDGRTGTAAP